MKKNNYFEIKSILEEGSSVVGSSSSYFRAVVK